MQSISELLSIPENEWINQVRQFNEEKIPFQILASTPTMPTPEEQVHYIASLDSEMAELSRAFATNDLVEVADAIGDSIYVLIGIALKAGLPLNAIFADIQRSNMDKYPAAPGTMGRRRADGSSMKPDNWVGPRIKELLNYERQTDAETTI